MALIFYFLLIICPLWAKEPLALYLTWTDDPTSTMTIQWHTKEGIEDSRIHYQQFSGEGWAWTDGDAVSYSSDSKRVIHTAQLQGLEAGADYRFRIGEEAKVYHFRTMPRTDERPIRFVVGGDAYFYESLFRKMNAQIVKTDPDFIVVGGDIAYARNAWSFFKRKSGEERRWATFLSEWQKTMVGEDGRLIPLIPVLGNHDIKKELEPGSIPPFFQLFALPERLKAYRALDFGAYLSLIMLDTGHYSPIAGKQVQWLEEALKERKDHDLIMAVYHVAAYPSVYNYKDPNPERLRSHWVPLFEQYGVDTAFEHHNHAYKRTYRLREGKVDPEGIQYLGDGSWGVPPRAPNRNLWYTAKVAKINSFWLVTLENGACTFESRDIKGKTIETVTSKKALHPVNH